LGNGEMTFRDDDINRHTDLTTIMEIQKVFDHYGKVHTVTIVMEGLWESRGVWEWLVTTPNIDIALHGWIHADHAGISYEGTLRMLRQCLSDWNKHNERMGRDIPLTVFYPPWNSYNDKTIKACEEVGLELNACVDPLKTYSFHWWEHVGGRGLKELAEVLREH